MDKEIIKKDYEISFLCREEKGPEEVLRLVKRSGGEVATEGPVERIALAYKIEKESSAYFGFFHFSFSPSDMKALEHDLTTSPAVLRYLIITPPFVKAKSKGTGKPRPQAPTSDFAPEKKQVPTLPLSNEALEKKIEEILQQ